MQRARTTLSALLFGVSMLGLGQPTRALGSQPPQACATPPSPPPPPPPQAAANAPRKTSVVASPLLDAKDDLRHAAAASRTSLEEAALADVKKQAGDAAAERVRKVMKGTRKIPAGATMFGDTLKRGHYFPDAPTIVSAALAEAARRGLALPKDGSPADLILARKDPAPKGAPTPLRIDFLVPTSKQADFKAMTAGLSSLTTKYALSESGSAALKNPFGALGGLAKAKPPTISITMDASADFTKQLADQKQEAFAMITASAYTAAMEKEPLWGSETQVPRWGAGASYAKSSVTSSLSSAYGKPGNAKVKEVAKVAGAQVLAEVAGQSELGDAVGQLAAAGPGSNLGVIFNASSADKARTAFGVKGDAIGVRMSLPNGEFASLPNVTTDELAQTLAYATVTPNVTAERVQAKLAAIRKK